MSEKGSNHQLLKQSNYNLIKKYIYRNSPISRVEIAQKLGLTTATITGMVNPMISSGLLVETTAPAEETKGAGRPRMMLEFAAEAYYICGVDTGPYRTNYIMTDLLGNTVAVRRTNQPLGDYQGTLERLAEEIPDFLRETGIPREKILGVGICLPGMIDGSADKIYDIFQDGWTEHSISTELGERIGLKVEVENNVRARAISAELFDRMVNLKSATLGIYEKGTGRAVVCNIAEFPYVLIWSKPGMPKFVCIEPWHSLPSAEGGSIKWEEKPTAAILNPGEAWSCTLSTSFVR